MAWSRGFGDSTDYVMLGGVILAVLLLAGLVGAPSGWLAIGAGIAIVAIIVHYRRKKRRSYMVDPTRLKAPEARNIPPT